MFANEGLLAFNRVLLGCGRIVRECVRRAMKRNGRIITVGLCPAWDITCRGEDLDWGLHKVISSCSCRPAGKALNISRALAWLGQKSTAAGLWGQEDYERMLKELRGLRGLVKVSKTCVSGATRWNITVVDTVNHREMHLRSKSELATKPALRKLKAELQAIVNENSVCVFAGSMPQGELLGDVVELIHCCRERGAKIVVDTSGAALRRIVDAGRVWLIKPNVEELSELSSRHVADGHVSLAEAGRELLDRVEIVLISRGRKGAVVITKNQVLQGWCPDVNREVLSTVACGDYLLAGFLKGLKDTSDAGLALKLSLKVATAQAWGWTDKMQWSDVQRKIKVQVQG